MYALKLVPFIPLKTSSSQPMKSAALRCTSRALHD